MPGFMPGIHVFFRAGLKSQTWMAGTSPAMTKLGRSRALKAVPPRLLSASFGPK
jgi:hypothetical protein